MLSDRELELIKATAKTTGDYLIESALPAALKVHLAECPYGKTLFKTKWLIIGAVIVGGLATAGGTPIIEKLWSLLVR